MHPRVITCPRDSTVKKRILIPGSELTIYIGRIHQLKYGIPQFVISGTRALLLNLSLSLPTLMTL